MKTATSDASAVTLIQRMWLKICCWCSKGQEKKWHLEKLSSLWLPSGGLTDAPVTATEKRLLPTAEFLTKAVRSDAYWLCWVNTGLFLSPLMPDTPPQRPFWMFWPQENGLEPDTDETFLDTLLMSSSGFLHADCHTWLAWNTRRENKQKIRHC